MTYDDVAQALAEAVPEFRPIVEEHLAYSDEGLPHFLFGQLRDFTFSAYSSRTPEAADTLRRILAFIERLARSDVDDVVELVAVSFLEYTWAEDCYEEFKAHLGPKTRALLEDMEPRPWRAP